MLQNSHGLPGVYDPSRPHDVQAFLPRPTDSFRLPTGVTKGEAIATIIMSLRLAGASATDISYFRHAADTTDRRSWSEGGAPPLNWRRQSDMARELCISERQARRVEARLEGMGVLARSTAENGYRGYRAGSTPDQPLRSGLSFAPALANYEAIMTIVTEAGIREAQRQEHLLHIRTARTRLTRLIEGVTDREIHQWARHALTALEADHSIEVLRTASADEVMALHEALLGLEDRLREALTPLPYPSHDVPSPQNAPQRVPDASDGGPKPNTPKAPQRRSQAPTSPSPHTSSETPPEDLAQSSEATGTDSDQEKRNMSGAPDMNVRCQIQPQLNSNSPCNDLRSYKQPPAKADDANRYRSQPTGRDHYLENKNENPSRFIKPYLLEKLTPERIRDLASEDAAMYLDAFEDWNEAIPMILRELGINVSAWFDACDAMGEAMAFLSLIIIDRNRFHPYASVHSPGGALRAFTDSAKAGTLNLTRSIIGIWERERQGKQGKK
ncbi:MAG: replication initiation protein RepC [Pseudomonadota bacterium]